MLRWNLSLQSQPWWLRSSVALLVGLVLSAPAIQAQEVCSGVVTVFRIGSSPEMRGDDEDNCITATQDENGDLTVTSTDNIIDGLEQPIDLEGVSHVRVEMGGGNDGVRLVNLLTPAIHWDLGGGDGNDVLAAERISTRTLDINADLGDDIVEVRDAIVSQRSTFDGHEPEGDQNDILHLNHVDGPADAVRFEALNPTPYN